MADWHEAAGYTFPQLRPFLMPLQEQGEDYPCTHQYRCGCRHRILYTSPDEISAVCTCTPPTCPPIRLSPKDTLIHVLNLRKFGNAIRTAFRFALPACDAAPSPHFCRVGDWGAARSPVIFAVPPLGGNEMLAELEKLCLAHPVPFILLIHDQLPGPALAESVIHRHGSVIIPLADKVTVAASGRFEVTVPIDGILAEFARRQVDAANLSLVVEEIRHDIKAIAQNQSILSQERDDLARLHTEGYLQFVTRISPADFHAFTAILVHGNRNAAAEALGVPARAFYNRVKRWATLGVEYRQIHSLVELRKRTASSVKLPMEQIRQFSPESLRQMDSRDYPAVLRQVFEALARQNPRNWEAVNREVSELIREEVPK